MNNSTIALYLPALDYLYNSFPIEIDDTDSDNYYNPNKIIRFQYYIFRKPIEEILTQHRKMNKELNKAMKRNKVNKFFNNLR